MFTDTPLVVGRAVDLGSPGLPFVWQPTNCDRCFRIGLRISPQGAVEQCPTLQMKDPHVELSPEGQRIVRAVETLRRRKLEPDTIHFDVARSLAQYDTHRPCSSRELIDRHFSYVAGAENRRRLVTKAVRFLREIWFLPVASRKEAPMGYWIATDLDDFKAYFERASAEPVTTLSTIHRMARANWPEFAEQMEIDIWKDMVPDETAT